VVFVIDRLAHCTVITALLDDPVPPLELEYEAWFVTVPHVAEVVGEVMWIVVDAPDAIDVDGHVRVPPPMVQALDQPDWLAIVQVRPLLVGRVSLRVTPVAVPGPAFDTVIVYPIPDPALTVAASTTLVIDTLGVRTTKHSVVVFV
jgi:hypothetical protein